MVCSSFGTAFGASAFGFMRDATGSYASSLVLVVVMYATASVLLFVSMATKKSVHAKALAATAGVSST
jgi:cyanate permease